MEKYYTSFARGQWNQDEWLIVRSHRWVEVSHWIQKDDCISNYMPDDLKPEDMQMGRDRTGESYISMLLKKPVTGGASGSPIFNANGEVVALLCGGNIVPQVKTEKGILTRLPSAALVNFAVRADLLHGVGKRIPLDEILH